MSTTFKIEKFADGVELRVNHPWWQALVVLAALPVVPLIYGLRSGFAYWRAHGNLWIFPSLFLLLALAVLMKYPRSNRLRITRASLLTESKAFLFRRERREIPLAQVFQLQVERQRYGAGILAYLRDEKHPIWVLRVVQEPIAEEMLFAIRASMPEISRLVTLEVDPQSGEKTLYIQG